MTENSQATRDIADPLSRWWSSDLPTLDTGRIFRGAEREGTPKVAIVYTEYRWNRDEAAKALEGYQPTFPDLSTSSDSSERTSKGKMNWWGRW